MAAQEPFDPAKLVGSGGRLSELLSVDGEAAINRVQEETADARPMSQAYSCQVVPVHTFILQGISKDVKLSKGILVPSFASHWGVVTGVPGALTLYHLVFVPDSRPPENDTSVTLRGKRRAIQFNHTPWPPTGRAASADYGCMTKVGETTYSHEDRIRLGNSMINAFGDYHRVFWNCQTFAKCYLKVICGEQARARFTSWTLSETSNMFLCAFVVGMPLATTLRINEMEHIYELLEAVQSENPPSDAELEQISDHAIDCILNQACTEPENRQILRVPPQNRGFFAWLGNFFRTRAAE